MKVLEFPRPSDAKGVPRIRVERGELFADVVLDRKSIPAMHFVIVQRHGSSSVLRLDRYESFEDAMRSAQGSLDALSEKAA